MKNLDTIKVETNKINTMKRNNPNKMNSIEDQKKTLIISIKDRNMNHLDQFQMTLTEHSSERIKERDICGDSLQLALIYGRAFFAFQ